MQPPSEALHLSRQVAERSIPEASVVSPQFRLFLTAEAVVEGCPRSIQEKLGIPVSIVSQSSMVSYERPTGALAGAVESISAISDDTWKSCDSVGRIVMLRVCLMHAALSQRSRFGLCGWLGSSKYGFAASDVTHSSFILPELAEKASGASSGSPESATAVNAWQPV